MSDTTTGHSSGSTSPNRNVVSNAPASPGPGTDVAQPRSLSPERFENPGLPPHRDRMADTDTKAAKRAERQVAFLFVLSILGTLLTLVGYFAVPLDEDVSNEAVLLSNILLGTGLVLALFGIGAGAVHWAKTLMPDHEEIDTRHRIEGSPDDQRDSHPRGHGRRQVQRSRTHRQPERTEPQREYG